ncbi:hypothetical protein AAHZ94_20455 [Streptomyces sp. HSW2009]
MPGSAPSVPSAAIHPLIGLAGVRGDTAALDVRRDTPIGPATRGD